LLRCAPAGYNRRMEAEAVAGRAAEVRERIERALARSGRSDPVTLVAITKTHPVETALAALAAGIGNLGENRVQELEAKARVVGRDAARWHLVGHLQRNKVARALPWFHLLHSLDSVRLAEALSAGAAAAGGTVHALVQVNTSGEESKHGLAATDAVEAVGRMALLPALSLEGVMTMAPFTADERTLRAAFSAARRLGEDLARQVPGFRLVHLSMGMSNDFEVAVEEGSTLVRVGSSLFGERRP
jgi:PLP dependent protein